MALDWDKLRIFHAVANAGSFTHAGEILNLSQSAISRHIAGLEDSLGVILFHRHARGLSMTEQGELLYATTRDVFQKLVSIEGQLGDSRDKPEGVLTITAAEFIGTGWIAPLVPLFLKRNPGIQIILTLNDRILNLGLREADVALRLFEPREPDLIQRPLTKISFGLYAAPGYLDRFDPVETIDALRTHNWIVFSEAAPYPESVRIETLVSSSPNPAHLIKTNTVSAMTELTRAGCGIALLPHFIARREPTALIRILPDLVPPPVDLYFVYPETRRHSRRIELFRDFLIQTLETKEL